MKVFWILNALFCLAIAAFDFSIGQRGLGIIMLFFAGINYYNYMNVDSIKRYRKAREETWERLQESLRKQKVDSLYAKRPTEKTPKEDSESSD